MTIESNKVYFFKGEHCQVCESVFKDYISKIEDKTIILPAEKNIEEIKSFTDKTNLPIIVWKDKSDNINVTSGLISKKDFSKIAKDVK